MEIDKEVKDVYGIPVLKLHMSDGENEQAMIKDIAESAGEMLEAAGAETYALAPIPQRRAGRFTKPASPAWAATPRSPVSINFSAPTTLGIFS